MTSQHSAVEAQLREAERVAYLIAGFLRGTLTPEEHQELDQWVEASDQNMLLFEELTDERNLPTIVPGGWKGAPLRRRPYRLRRLALSAAAAVILLLGATGWWLLGKGPGNPAPPAAAHSGPSGSGNAAGVSLTFPGTTLTLPRDTSFWLTHTTRLTAGPQQLTYGGSAGHASLPQVLQTPPGRTYRLQLGDGTRVWLNADSRLDYPSTFAADARAVRLEGEGYFEVAPDAKRPFRVLVRGLELRVLGTTFNIEAYDTLLSATLMEGRLKVAGQQKTAILTPGEQLRASATGSWQKNKRADVEAALGWQSGLFVFRDTPLERVLAQLGHWYGVSTRVVGRLPYHITATLPRSLPLSQVLRILELTGRVRFELKGRTLQAEGIPPARP